MVVAVIPARYGSTRLPAKPLADICGKPMIQWVYEKSKQSKLCQRVLVATDDERVASAVRAFGGEAVMTSPDIQSGTDRMAAVARMVAGEVFVNVQGDEPLIDAASIDQAIRPVLEGKFSLSSLRVPLKTVEDLKMKIKNNLNNYKTQNTPNNQNSFLHQNYTMTDYSNKNNLKHE